MQWSRLDDDNGYRRLSVEAEWSELAGDYDDIVAGYAQARLPGFRPGRVPQAVIEKRFQKEMMDELTRRCTQRLGREAIRGAGMEPLGPLEATDIECEKGKPFRFKVCYLPMPQIELPDYGLLKAEDYRTDPRDRLSRRLLDLVQFDVPDEIVMAELALEGAEDSDPSCGEWSSAAERVRLMLILKKIAGAEGIEVDETDIERRIRDKAIEFGQEPDKLKAELEKGSGLQRLREMLLAESTLDYLIERTQK